mmetsp:Transcript_17443/g.41904  ORF Transcript_17443/g.41904 Transcript_17443/m.41904 type:complete len:369 (-) Transcript_17443:280-1386(-)
MACRHPLQNQKHSHISAHSLRPHMCLSSRKPLAMAGGKKAYGLHCTAGLEGLGGLEIPAQGGGGPRKATGFSTLQPPAAKDVYLIECGKGRVYVDASSSSLSWSLVNLKSNAPRLSSSCWTVRAPIRGDVQARQVQLMATCAGVLPISLATFSTVDRIFQFCSSFTCLLMRPVLAVGWMLSCLCLPVRNPSAITPQGTMPRPHSTAIGSRSFSKVRSSMLYLVCRAMNGVQSLKCAMVFAFEMTHAGVSDTPQYSTLPHLTQSSRARITSSTGVRYSHAWMYNKSMYPICMRLSDASRFSTRLLRLFPERHSRRLSALFWGIMWPRLRVYLVARTRLLRLSPIMSPRNFSERPPAYMFAVSMKLPPLL